MGLRGVFEGAKSFNLIFSSTLVRSGREKGAAKQEKKAVISEGLQSFSAELDGVSSPIH